MWEATAELPEQIGRAIDAALDVDLGGMVGGAPVRNVVVCGMGGSGIAGDVVSAIAWTRADVPVTVVKSYGVPRCVGPGTLFFAVSCSGGTEETLAAAAEARGRGASLVTVAGAGALADLASREGSPLVRVPAAIPQPRAALGALSVPPLVVLERLGLFDGVTRSLRSAVALLGRRRDLLVRSGSLAEDLARGIADTIPLVQGANGPTGVAAMRWKTQINENAKSPAFWSLQPELCHNEVAGWARLAEETGSLFTVVTLRHSAEHPRVALRFEIVKEIVGPAVAAVVEARTDAMDDVGALFDLSLLGDFVSLHLAANAHVDPGPVPVLSELKAQLSEWNG